MLQTEINLGRALAGLREEIQVRIKEVTHAVAPSEEFRKRCWLAIKALQRAEGLMREAMEIVSC